MKPDILLSATSLDLLWSTKPQRYKSQGNEIFVDFLKSIKKHLRNVSVILSQILKLKPASFLLDWEVQEN